MLVCLRISHWYSALSCTLPDRCKAVQLLITLQESLLFCPPLALTTTPSPWALYTYILVSFADVQIITKVGGTPPKLDATPEDSEAPSGSQPPFGGNQRSDAHRLASERSTELPSSSKG